ncbi:unnamed protein product [Auanema sp. JU1783]|nr:unnamed protein product [Auanema sp. JU1783]
MVVRKVWLVPVMAVVTSTLAFLSSLIVGNMDGHLKTWITSVSTAGSHSPESCLFSQFLNISAFFLILTFYVRHRQTVEYYAHRLQWEGNAWRICSLIFMWVGIISAVSLTVVANFPKTEAILIHDTAAAFTFLTQIVYSWGQVVIGFAMIPHMASTFVNFLRLFLAILATFFVVLHEAALVLNPSKNNGTNLFEVHETIYSDNQASFNQTVFISTEWLMILAMQLFLLTFTAELRFAYAHVPRVVFCRSAMEIGYPAEPRHVKIVHIPSSNMAFVEDGST